MADRVTDRVANRVAICVYLLPGGTHPVIISLYNKDAGRNTPSHMFDYTKVTGCNTPVMNLRGYRYHMMICYRGNG